jgi:hypothetical protein
MIKNIAKAREPVNKDMLYRSDKTIDVGRLEENDEESDQKDSNDKYK